MNEALDKQLCEKYPKIFKDRHASMQETCMCWGICTGDGWYNILDQLCGNIQHHIDWKEKTSNSIEQVVASQVKEKFGTLRFYYTGGDDIIDGMVQMAEAMSSVTCEECGASGKTNDGGWLSTRCEAHTNK
jgi:hypothetical protein